MPRLPAAAVHTRLLPLPLGGGAVRKVGRVHGLVCSRYVCA